ncbi:uncharacterized protein LOC129795899 [Lutzomyia longipalpis]|uniref:uncharacterized protein LOC129795899 n=1 Tax=Lutzomyia longipalpis TaxID=7200 RepID=UPI0024840A8A|nr:uncharacterized protein LOC129795899 [Lutzomyia longipalpis]
MGFRVNLSIFLLIFSVNPLWGWCLKNLGMQEGDYELLHLSLYKFRAFLSIRSNSEGRIATLIEAPWPENSLSFATRPFPGSVNGEGEEGVCQGIVQSWRTAVDTKGRLWVVDRGDADGVCPPKIVIFNLRKTWKSEVHRHVFTNATEGLITSLTIDPQPHGSFTRAYLTLRGSNCIAVYSLEEKKFWTLCTKSTPLQFTETIILPTGILYLYDGTQNILHATDLHTLRKKEFHVNEAFLIQTVPIGNLLGHARSLLIDTQNSLYYIIPRFGAVVKWNIE